MSKSPEHGRVWPLSLKHLTSLASLCLLVVLLAAPLSQVAASDGQTGKAGLAQPTIQRVGPTDRNQQINIAVGLKVQDQAALDAFTASLYDPASPNYKQYITSQQFTDRYVSQADRAQVVSYLQSQGLKVQDSGLGILVDATGTVAQMEKTFGVTISDYRESRTGRVFYRNEAEPVFPAALGGRVQSVAGLTDYNQRKPRYQKTDPQIAPKTANGTPAGCSAAVNAATTYGALTPNQFKTAYNFDPLYSHNISGTGQTIALYELDDYSNTNIANYQSCFGTNVPLQRVAVDGGVSSIGDGQVEVELDIEVVVGLAPGLSKVLVYEAPNTNAGYIDEFQKIANDNAAQIVSISWGDCEGDTAFVTHQLLDTENTIFQQMATQGQSVFSASGDYGANGCLPINGDPGVYASDILDTPYVTGVGGTRIQLNADNTINNEITWNDFATDYGASGGGPSNYFARPAWQTGPGTNTSLNPNNKRMTPDVSAVASPYSAYVVYTVGGWTSVGGTSAASPLWAAAAALTNHFLNVQGQPNLGFANPTIYRIYNSAGRSRTYHDMTTGDICYDAGNNTVNPPRPSTCGVPNSGTGLYPATPGYDMATGLGTLNAYSFARNSCMVKVTDATDGGGAGTLRTLLNTANQTTAPCKAITLDNANLNSAITLSQGLTISNGVTVFGPACGPNGPSFNIKGANNNTTSGITLSGGGLVAVKISGFGGFQLITQGGGNYLSCVKASKS